MRMQGKIFLSLIIGTVMGAVTLLVTLFLVPDLALPLAVLALSAVAIAMHLVLSLIETRLNKQFAKIEQMLQSPVIYKTVANFNLGSGEVNGRVYVCRDGIVLATVDQTPYAVQHIPSDQLARCEQNDMYLHLYTKAGREYRLMMPDAPEVVKIIRKSYWNG